MWLGHRQSTSLDVIRWHPMLKPGDLVTTRVSTFDSPLRNEPAYPITLGSYRPWTFSHHHVYFIIATELCYIYICGSDKSFGWVYSDQFVSIENWIKWRC